MNQTRPVGWLIVDCFLLALSLMLLLMDLLVIGDIVWTLAALLGVFIFSLRVGRDIRRLRAK